MSNIYRLIDPKGLDPLPTFAMWDGTGGGIYDSYGGHVADYSISGNSEFNNNGNIVPSISGQASSSSRTTGWPSYTCANQAEGNWTINPPGMGGFGTGYRREDRAQLVWPDYGTVIGNSGIRQRISIHANGNVISVYARGSFLPYESLTTNTSPYRNIIGEPGTNCRGMISYNDRTRTLAYMVSDSSLNYRVHVWRHPQVSLNDLSYKTGQLYKFLTEAKSATNGASYYYNDFAFSSSGASSYTESMHHIRIVMGDNGTLGLIRFTPSTQTIHRYAVLNAAGTAITGTVTAVSDNTVTTSYGIEQGNYYGMRSNITWDNLWVAAYAPYYYYGSGFASHFVYTPDPSKGYKFLNSSTSTGCQVVPVLEGQFLFRQSDNTDGGTGVSVSSIDPTGAFVNERNANGAAISNGGTLVASSAANSYDVFNTSTAYVPLIPMGSWYGGGR